jgi:peptide/nickel transport system substrate-binding protein
LLRSRILLSLTAFFHLSAQAAPQVKNHDTVVKTAAAEWATLDPAQCYDLECGEVLHNLFDTLIGYKGSSSKLVPLLAHEIPTRANKGISEDGRIYTFKLRQNIRFTDGTPVTAQDVEYSLRRMLVVSALTGPAGLLVEPLLGTTDLLEAKSNPQIYRSIEKAIQATDKYTIIIRLTQPFAPLLAILANPYFSIYSRSHAVNAGAWSGTERDWVKYNRREASPFRNKPPRGSGPYKVASYSPGQSLLMIRNMDYWQGPARIKHVALQGVPDESATLLMIRKGDADIVGVRPALLSQLKDVSGVVVKYRPTLSLNGLFFNQKITGPIQQLGSGKLDGKGVPANFFSDIHIRRGFAHSIDRQLIVREILSGQGIARKSLALSNVVPEQPNIGYAYDSKKAQQEFRQAFGGEVWEKGFLVSIYSTNDPIRQSILRLIKHNIEALNSKFRINVLSLTPREYFARRAGGELTAWIGNWTLDYADPHNLFQPWVGTGGTYATTQNFQNLQIDHLIRRAVKETDLVKRQALYLQIQQLHAKSAFGIPIYQVVNPDAQRTWLKGRTFNIATVGDSFYEMSK